MSLDLSSQPVREWRVPPDLNPKGCRRIPISTPLCVGWTPQHAWCLFDHLVRARKQRGRDSDPKRLGGLKIENQLILGWLLHG